MTTESAPTESATTDSAPAESATTDSAPAESATTGSATTEQAPLEYAHTTQFRGARFTDADLSGTSFEGVNLSDATFRDCDLSRVKIVDAFLVDVNVSGLIKNIMVDDVDVTAFVEGELDRRHPERVQVRALRGSHSADDYREMWTTIERLWAETTAQFERLPEAERHERVDDEWSFVETMRHLIFATDAWVSRTILDEPMPYHRLGYTHSSYPPEDALKLGVELSARPSYDVVMEVRANRMAVVRGVVDRLTDAELEQEVTRLPAPGYPEETRTVGYCLRVIMGEECEHRRYMVRDLPALLARQAPDGPQSSTA